VPWLVNPPSFYLHMWKALRESITISGSVKILVVSVECTKMVHGWVVLVSLNDGSMNLNFVLLI